MHDRQFPTSVIQESGGAARQKIFMPSLNKTTTTRNMPVPGKKPLTRRMLVNMELIALSPYANIPCGEKTNGSSSHKKMKLITSRTIWAIPGLSIMTNDRMIIAGMAISSKTTNKSRVRVIV